MKKASASGGWMHKLRALFTQNQNIQTVDLSDTTTIEYLKACLHTLEKQMGGLNFQVTLGIEFFTDCHSYEDFAIKLKQVFPESRPEQAKIIQIAQATFWQELNDCLGYRGDKAHYISPKKEPKIKAEQKKYIHYLTYFLSDSSKIFSYSDPKGIPGYPVWWEYRFVLFNENGQCLFIFGSASD